MKITPSFSCIGALISRIGAGISALFGNLVNKIKAVWAGRPPVPQQESTSDLAGRVSVFDRGEKRLSPLPSSEENGVSIDASSEVPRTLELKDAQGNTVQGHLVLSPGKRRVTLQHYTYGEGSKSYVKGDRVEITIKDPIYRFNSAQFGYDQKWPVCLVMGEDDFETLQKTIRDYAFGEDYRRLAPLSDSQEGRVAVWKIPSDLLHISGYQGRCDDRTYVPQGVGTRFLQDDRMGQDATPVEVVGKRATKLRIDLKNPRASVHCFQVYGGTERFAGISTGNFFNNFNCPTDEEGKKFYRLLKALEKCGVLAFSCNTNHHAIVLYAKQRDSKCTPMTPELFADLLKTDDRIFQAVQEAANQDMKPWKEAFIKVFSQEESRSEA